MISYRRRSGSSHFMLPLLLGAGGCHYVGPDDVAQINTPGALCSFLESENVESGGGECQSGVEGCIDVVCGGYGRDRPAYYNCTDPVVVTEDALSRVRSYCFQEAGGVFQMDDRQMVRQCFVSGTDEDSAANSNLVDVPIGVVIIECEREPYR